MRAALGVALALVAAAPASAQDVQRDPWRVTFAGKLATRGPIVDGARALRATGASGNTYDVLLDDGRLVRVTVRADGETISAPDGARTVAEAFAASPGEKLYGTGERSDALIRNGRETENYVSDGPYREPDRGYVKTVTPPWAARDRDDATYFPVPWLLSSRGAGVLVDEDATSRFTSSEGEWTASVDGARLRLRVFSGATPAAALGAFTAATGRQAPPSRPYAFGPWFQTGQPNVVPPEQERMITEAQRRAGVAVSVAETQMHYLPCGAQQGREAEERARADYFHAQALARLVYFNPLLCLSYRAVYDRAAAAGVLQQGPGGTPFTFPAFVGGSGPAGFTSEPLAQFDFTAPGTEDFYAELVKAAVEQGADGFMEDFGESTPPTVVQHDGSTGDAAHNRYPRDYHCALQRIAARFGPLTRFQRSGWTGTVRCADVVWGGDPTTVWDYDGLRSAVTQLLSAGLSGISRWGTDIGGYDSFGPQERLTDELLTRWMELGALIPVMRTKRSGLAVPSYERPQVYDDKHLADWQRLTALHTQLNRYLRHADAGYRRRGVPIARALVLRYPRRAEALAAEDEYLLGPDLLVAPVVTPGAKTRKLWLPPGRWVDWWRSVDYDAATRAFTPHRPRILRGDRTVELPAPLGYPPLLLRRNRALSLLDPAVTSLYAPYRRRLHVVGALSSARRLRLPRRKGLDLEIALPRRPRRVPGVKRWTYRDGILRARL